MIIHMFIAHMGVGGAERVCVNLANEWAARGHEVHIAVLNLDNDVNTHLLREEVKVHELGVSRLRYAAIPMLKYIKRYRPGFIFVFGKEMAIILNKLRKLKLTNVKVIVRVLNNVNIALSKDDHVSPIVEHYLDSAQKQLADMEGVIAQCKAMGAMLTEAGIVSKEKMHVVYNPVSSELIAKTETCRKESDDSVRNRITFIGRVDPQKQPEQLIKAFAIVRDKREGATLRIVGDGNLMEQTKQLVKELNLSECVIFDGIRKDMENVYADTDLVILSSAYEGMPNALIEAIGCGIPVVSYDCPIGPAEIIEDGVNGFLVKQDDIEALADKAYLALEQSWDRDIIKATCKKFDVAEIATEYEEIFS